MKRSLELLAAGLVALGLAASAFAQDNKLRLITWADYVPADVLAQFKKETGIDVEVTLSNNEEMISKLRATGGAGFDLAQPSQDRIVGPQQEFGIYKPMDMTQDQDGSLHPVDARRDEEEHDAEGPGVRAAAHLGHRRPRRQHQARADDRLPGPVQGRVQGQDQHAPEAPDAARVRVRERQGPVRAVQRSQGLRGADGRRRQEARRVQGQHQVLLGQQGPAAERRAHRRDRRRDDVGHRRLEAQRREPRDPVHRAEVGRAGLDRHVRAAGEGPQRRRGVRVDQLQHAARDRGEGRGLGRQLHRRRRAPTS